ncbi:MAG TPA: ATP-binding cassette domain-containing protein [Spirochaetia bacterium]
MDIISISGLRKSFKGRRGKGRPAVVEAVRGIDLAVHEGEIFGFLGPNGAGKSTTLRMLSTLLPADAGDVRIAGYDLQADPRKVRRVIGYVSQAGGTDVDMTGRENIVLQAGLYGLSTEAARRRAEELTEALGLGDFVDRFAKTYSGGQKRKVDIAVGMVNSPRILFLDEPTTGLDPVSRSQLWAQIRLLRKLGTTVFITTHYMDEADALCDRIAIMDHGTIVAEGTPSDLKRRVEGDIVSLSVNHVENATELAVSLLQGHELVKDIAAEDQHLKLNVTHGGEALPVILRLLESKGIGVAEITVARPSLDDVFLRATGHSLKDETPSAATPSAASSRGASR